MAILVKIYCYGTVLIVCEWLLDEIEIEDNHLAELFKKALPDALRTILC